MLYYAEYVVFCEDRSLYRDGYTEPLVHLVSADLAQVIPSYIEEQVVQIGLRAFYRYRIAGAKLLVYFYERFFFRLYRMLGQCFSSEFRIPQGRLDLLLRAADG